MCGVSTAMAANGSCGEEMAAMACGNRDGINQRKQPA